MGDFLRATRAQLEQSWHAFVDRRECPEVRDEVLDSWQRSAQAVDPDTPAAPTDAGDEAVARWRDSPIARACDNAFDDLRRVALDGDFVAAITDSDGYLVWTEGGRTMRRRAERVQFVPGGCWDEPAIGTNALALALRTGRPATVFSAEHYAPIVHDWVCYSAPILEPGTARVLGVVDLSTTWRRATPLAISTATALARCIELSLATLAPTSSALAVPTTGLELRTLGRSEVLLDGVYLPVTPRQIELLAVLSLFPQGLSLDMLHAYLYGDASVTVSTLKAELSHLRRLIGPRLASRPYRLDPPPRADHLDVLVAIRDGRLDDAIGRYGGTMLERSSSPAVEEHRRYLDVALRTAVLGARDPDHLFAFGEHHPWDRHVHEITLATMTATDRRRPIVEGRLARC